jgi:hypothetical protein
MWSVAISALTVCLAAQVEAPSNKPPEKLVRIMKAIDRDLKKHRADIPWLKKYYADDSLKFINGWPIITAYGANDMKMQAPEQIMFAMGDIHPPQPKQPVMRPSDDPVFEKPECFFFNYHKRLYGTVAIYDAPAQADKIRQIAIAECQKAAHSQLKLQ